MFYFCKVTKGDNGYHPLQRVITTLWWRIRRNGQPNPLTNMSYCKNFQYPLMRFQRVIYIPWLFITVIIFLSDWLQLGLSANQIDSRTVREINSQSANQKKKQLVSQSEKGTVSLPVKMKNSQCGDQREIQSVLFPITTEGSQSRQTHVSWLHTWFIYNLNRV